MITRMLIRHILPLIRDLIDQYLDEESTASKEQFDGFFNWLAVGTKDDNAGE